MTCNKKSFNSGPYEVITIAEQGPPGPPGVNGTNGTNGTNGQDGSNLPKYYSTLMTAGVLLYTLPELPTGAVDARINGVSVNHTLVGVNLTITEYTAGSIESDDELRVLYFTN